MKCRSNPKPRIATATVTDYRSPLWLVGKQPPAPRQHVTAWGEVKVERGNPTSLHRDILDAIFSSAVRAVQTPTGELHVLFDAATVLRMLGTKADSRWLRQRLLDLMQVVISVRTPGATEWPPSWSLLSYVGDTNLDADRGHWQFGAKLKKIVLSPAAVAVMAEDIRIVLDRKIVQAVLGLDHAISRALARWLMSHRSKQTHSLESMLDALGARHVGDRQRRTYMSQIRADTVGLKSLGIVVGDDSVTYTRPETGVWFQMPGAE